LFKSNLLDNYIAKLEGENGIKIIPILVLIKKDLEFYGFTER